MWDLTYEQKLIRTFFIKFLALWFTGNSFFKWYYWITNKPVEIFINFTNVNICCWYRTGCNCCHQNNEFTRKKAGFILQLCNSLVSLLAAYSVMSQNFVLFCIANFYWGWNGFYPSSFLQLKVLIKRKYQKQFQ